MNIPGGSSKNILSTIQDKVLLITQSFLFKLLLFRKYSTLSTKSQLEIIALAVHDF